MRFRTLMFAHMLLLVAAVLAAALATIVVIMGRTAERQATAELGRARDVFTDQAGYRSSLYEAQAGLIAEEPRLKAVVVTQDTNPATVLDVAGELSTALKADRFLVTNADGRLIADVGHPEARGNDLSADPLVVRAFSEGGGAAIWIAGGQAYEMHARRLSFGAQEVGVVAIGYAIDDRIVRDFDRLTATSVVVELDGRLLATSAFAGEVPEPALLARVPDGQEQPSEVNVGGTPYLAVAGPFPGGAGSNLRFVVLRSLAQALAAKRSFTEAVVLIALVALGVVLLIAAALARRLSRPLDQLVAVTRRVAEGHLDARVPAGDYVAEVQLLADSLNSMVQKLDESKGRLILADRMASVGTLASGVAHEINNPLAYVTANLEVLAQQLPELTRGLPPERVRELQETIKDSREGADRVRQIVRDLKVFSRADEEKRGPVEVEKALELAINMTRNEIRHRARLVREYGAIPPVQANESRLGQVFVNLLVNAAQAITEGHADKNEIHVKTFVDAGGRVVVEVRDTGSGIPRHIRDRIFDPFFTTKEVGVGTGLGLAICHGILANMGGEIHVDSEIDKGSTFRVILPAASGPAEAVAVAAKPAALEPRHTRVLLVDDEPMFATALRRGLAPDHDLVAVTNARAALDRLRGEREFDVILCDLMMPEMTGMDLHAELRRSAPHLIDKMIFVTGGAFTAHARKFLDEVPNPRLEKPVDIATLRAAIRERRR